MNAKIAKINSTRKFVGLQYYMLATMPEKFHPTIKCNKMQYFSYLKKVNL